MSEPPSEGPRSGSSRRTLLRRLAATSGIAGVAAGAGGTVGTAATRSEVGPTVLTQNVYLGVDVSRLLRANSIREFRRIVGRFLEGIDPAVYRARADAVAAEVAAADPDVIALQEAALFRKQEPGDYTTDGAESAETEVVDLLAEVEAALDARGLDYGRAAATTASDAELPGRTDDGPVDLRVTDRDALLVRADRRFDGVVTDTFDTDIAFAVPETDQEVSLRRGYARADVTVDGTEFAAVSTHLESVSSTLRVIQARELSEALEGTDSVVLCGDLNSGPGYEPAAYRLLVDEYDDAFERVYPRARGSTCCQSPDLRNDRSELSRRIDAVLTSGDLRAVDVSRINHRRADRVDVAVDDGEEDEDDGGATGEEGGDEDDERCVTVWPSDHAGLVATFERS
ncbi:endonuclease/exonuclease/phosphatase family protein [Halobaculum sp. EA56]|uniref:endonuclease/exonuclease/phosphatase family protein n=1 Tax=Halobaculum sp. EA56 TaxID=3421648 RepID=UPI003EB6A9AF